MIPYSAAVRKTENLSGQGRTHDFISGGAGWRARERQPIMGVWGLCPQRGPGAEPLVGVRGAKPPPPEAESYLL